MSDVLDTQQPTSELPSPEQSQEKPKPKADKAKAEKPKNTKEPLTEAQMEQITMTTKQLLDAQPKRKVRLYLPPEERQKLEAAQQAGKQVTWPSEFVQINGYGYQIMRGVDVEVPESVAEVLEQAGMF